MAITPISHAMIQRTDDVGLIKRNEDSKPLVDQRNIQVQVEQRQEVLKHQVIDKGNSSKLENHTDAREEGKGKYSAKKNAKKKKREEEQTNRVIKKQSNNSFDMKV